MMNSATANLTRSALYRLLLLLGLCLSSCFAPHARVSPIVGQFDLTGEFGAATGGSTVASSSLSDLGLGESEAVFDPRLDLEWLGLHLSLSALEGTYSGEGTTDAEIDIGGTAIGSGVDVESDLEFAATTLALTWDIVPTSALDVGIGLGLSQIEFDARFEEQLSGDVAETDESFPVPLLVGRVGSEIGPVGVGLVVGLIDLDIDGTSLSYLNLDLSADYHILGGDDRLRGDIVLGYRQIEIDAEYEDDSSEVLADVELSGPYLGVRFSF